MASTLIAHEPKVARVPTPPLCRKVAFFRRARLTLGLALLAFVVFQGGLRLVIDRYRPDLRDPTFEIKYRQLTQRLSRYSPAPATVLFLGSSITANGIDAKLAETPVSEVLRWPVVSYNLATYGAGPLTNLLYVQRMLRRGLRPDLVVLELSALGFDKGESTMDIQRLSAQLLEYDDLDVVERHSVQPELRREWWEANLVPSYGHRLMILNSSARRALPYKDRVETWMDADGHGWNGRAPLESGERTGKQSEIEAAFKVRLAQFKIDQAPVRALRELVELLAQQRIATIMVVMPEGPVMRSFYARNGRAAVQEAFYELSRTHGFRLIDANAWFDEEYFRDSYHLHREGARLFTERLVREAVTPAAVLIDQPNSNKALVLK